MFDSIEVGVVGERSLVVAEEHTAARWGSGALQVFSTPHMVALMEGAAVDAVDPVLPEGYQTVGVHLHVDHLAATPIGQKVTARARLLAVDGRKLVFRVEAFDDAGMIGEGEHQRFIINVARFMQKATARPQGS